ncbi:flagellar motor protein MotB [Psychrobacter piscatorii]
MFADFLSYLFCFSLVLFIMNESHKKKPHKL